LQPQTGLQIVVIKVSAHSISEHSLSISRLIRLSRGEKPEWSGINLEAASVILWIELLGIIEESEMCRSIKQLRRPEEFPGDEEIQAAALQYVRKISGYRKPSRANQVAFEQAVAQVTEATRTLLELLAEPKPGE
jgi:hypothetical protein